MKKAIKIISCFILFVFSLQNIAFCQTDYEKKLEYRRKKVEVLVRTAYVGETSNYLSSDTSSWSYAATPEGYSYGYSSMYGTTGGRSSFRPVSDWVIVKGGIRELSDIEFLDIVGDSEKAAEVQKIIDEKNSMTMWAIGCGVVGVAAVIGASSFTPVNSSQFGIGSALILGGIVLAYLYAPQRHYLTPDYVQESADKYNIKLKKDLGLPVETE
jgi:hypothetical protein